MSNPKSFAALSDRELLGRLVGQRAARRIYQGSLKSLFIGDAGPAQEKCAVARELVMRCFAEEMKRTCVLSAPGAVRDYLQIHFAGQEYETFVVLYLDAQNRLMTMEVLFRGTLTQTSVYPREIVKSALRENAAAVIFAHNHPSGCAEPSSADEILTLNLKQALALVDVRVLDHFVVAGASMISFAERNML